MLKSVDNKTLDRIEYRARKESVAQIASYLQKVLGQRLIAYIVGLKDQKMVGSWIQGKSQPRNDLVEARLREAYMATQMIVHAYGEKTAKAWFFGTNSRLGNQSPAYLLRHTAGYDDIQIVAPVAHAFVEFIG